MNHQDALAVLTRTGGWHTSSYSQGQNDCVEITTELPGWIGVRDSKLGAASPLLAFTATQWRAMLSAAPSASSMPGTRSAAQHGA